MTGAQGGQGGGHGEAQAEAAWCQGEGGKSDPEGQEPLSSLHMILREERRREERSEETDFIKTDVQNRKKKKKKSFGINTRSHPSPESWQEGPGAGLRCKLPQH